jgi:hypothetical protein
LDSEFSQAAPHYVQPTRKNNLKKKHGRVCDKGLMMMM